MRRLTKNNYTRLFYGCVPITIAVFSVSAQAQDSDVSPARQITRDIIIPERPTPPVPPEPDAIEYRSIDGSGNNIDNPEWGKTHTQLTRLTPPTYIDGISEMGDDGKPNVRSISVAFGELEVPAPTRGPSDFVWQWGQFLDHDLSLSEGVSPAEPHPIDIPEGDSWFDPLSTGTQTMAFNRTIYDSTSGGSISNPRQQINEITAWIDASNVYGSSTERANHLRSIEEPAKLKTSPGNYLPKNSSGLANAGGDSPELFLAGDVRANEQLGLLSMHTLFVREHNRLVDVFKEEYPQLTDDELYQKARKVVAGQMQKITYSEFLPTLLGYGGISHYRGYKKSVDPRLSNEFTTALYRFGHSLVSPTLLRIDKNGASSFGHLALREAFFAPYKLQETDIDPILRGLAAQPSQKIDLSVVSELSNFLFGNPGQGGFDLVSLNIQRGRDHGLASYNQTRLALGLSPAFNMDDISSNSEIVDRLNTLYDGNVDKVDLWVGALAEDTYNGMVGELLFHGLKEQFEKLRDGDRFWYLLDLDQRERAELDKLSDIIKRNTNIGNELSRNVFYVR